MTIGESIKKARKSRGMTQQKLSRLSGVQQQLISFYENGKYIPNVLTLCSLADALNVSLDELVGRSFP